METQHKRYSLQRRQWNDVHAVRGPKWRKEERREGNKWCDNGLHVDHVEDSGAAGLPGPWDGEAYNMVGNMVGYCYHFFFKILNQNQSLALLVWEP